MERTSHQASAFFYAHFFVFNHEHRFFLVSFLQDEHAMIDSFINYLEFEKKASPHTVEAYRRDLSQLEEFVALSFQEEDISQLSHLELRAWIIELVDSGLSTLTVNRKMATLRSYYKFLLRS